MSVLLYRTPQGPVAVIDGAAFHVAPSDWDTLLNTENLLQHLLDQASGLSPMAMPDVLLAPMVGQELWGAGVTYFRSRTARIEESKEAGGGDFYDRVYEAERPELFFKSTAQRVSPPGGVMRLRKDSRWIVPEPELALVVNNRSGIIGFTIANDLSCRDIEAENPLYLSQAKIFDGCASIGPGLLIRNEPLPASTRVHLDIRRNGATVSNGETSLAELRRDPEGIVPDDDFCLQPGDEVNISIDAIGTLSNIMK